MRTIPYDIFLGIARGNALNQDIRYLWDLQNGYINKQNDLQMRNGLSTAEIVAGAGTVLPIYGTPAITCIEEIEWNSETKDIICKAGTAWWIYRPVALQGTTTSTSAGKLVDSGASFTDRDVGRKVTNTTDQTTTYVTARDSATTLSVANDIFTSGENYTIHAGFGQLVGSRSATYRGQVLMYRTNANAEILILIDGGTPQKVTSAYVVSNLGGSPPSDATCGTAHNFHVILNSLAAKGKVYVSALNNPEDYTSVRPVDALVLELAYVTPKTDDIVSFSSFSEDVLVIRGEKYTVTYNAPEDAINWSILQKYESSNVSNHCQIERGSQLFFPTLSGMESMSSLAQNKEVPTDDMTRNIVPLYQSLLSTLGVSSAYQITGLYDRILDLVYICFPFTGTCQMLVYSFQYGEFVGRFLYSAVSIRAMTRRVDGSILVGDSAGQVYTMNSGTTDNGTIIPFTITPAFDYYGSKGRYKQVKMMRVTVEHSSTFTMDIANNYDTQAGTEVSKSITAVALGRNVVPFPGFTGRGRAFQPVITHDTTSGVIINIPYFEVDVVDEGVK